VKIDIGCGKNCKEGFEGIDSIDFGQKHVGNALEVMAGFEDGSIEEVHCSHFIEHLTWPERVNFFNELYRVMQEGAKCTLILPHWNSMRYYGDPTHKEPMSEFTFYYLSAEWRKDNAPHVGYTCNFECTWGYGLNPAIVTRPAEFQQFAMANYKEAITDIHATLIRK
jgi:hypothetical protein